MKINPQCKYLTRDGHSVGPFAPVCKSVSRFEWWAVGGHPDPRYDPETPTEAGNYLADGSYSHYGETSFDLVAPDYSDLTTLAILSEVDDAE